MRRRTPARWLAPLALVACVGAVYAVISAGLGDDGTSTSTASTPARTTTQRTASRAVTHFYTVRPGDVLSAIAERTGVPVATLLQLNPDVDAQSLRPGQRLRLRR